MFKPYAGPPDGGPGVNVLGWFGNGAETVAGPGVPLRDTEGALKKLSGMSFQFEDAPAFGGGAGAGGEAVVERLFWAKGAG